MARRWLEGIDLAAVVWDSEALIVAIADPSGTIAGASPGLVRAARRDPVGQPLDAFIAVGQELAFRAWLNGLGRTWRAHTWGALADEHDVPLDFRFHGARRPNGRLVLVGERLHPPEIESALLGVNREVIRAQRRTERERRSLDRTSREDALTGVANRRAFDRRLAAETETAQRPDAYALVMIDIDHFKSLNDRFGHQAGDAVLRWLGAKLRAAARATDLVARYGGEEFVALLMETSASDAAAWAERLRLAVRSEPPGEITAQVTISLGAAAWQVGQTAAEVIAQADRKLYEAKHAGRDRVCV